ncbi:hypothetical protein MARCHEWKA_02730 [Brevundimonas phage vB_BpoS-Marchewka]|uniref:Lipoprotein n=1 Tax=Brevundimonas phage vB_BpoS-Marchewka TaxID=2948604 RepID=A0A9E7N4A1_9CAUD|nr:hypothetical protein MARCHEWKA_02730 [Brevundimonas phage vB_BpoS-Marchewka]
MPRIKLILLAAALGSAPFALAACQPADQAPAPAAMAVAAPTASGPSQAAIQTEDKPAGDPLWTYTPLMQVRQCEIGAFTYGGQSYLISSSEHYSRAACAIELAPR